MTLHPMIALTVYFAVGLSHPDLEREQQMINPDHLRELIVEILDTSPDPRLNSPVAVELLMLTAATESHLGYYLRQTSGPAQGIFQMEPFTEACIWENYLVYPSKDPLSEWARSYDTAAWRIPDLKYNLGYQIVMARLHYWRVREPLPPTTEPYNLAWYWKKHYNTVKGKGTVTKAVIDYKRLVLQLED